MTEWFGKGCKYLCAQWEENEITGGPNYKESEPVLVFCTHVENNSEYEGNCNLELCPKTKDKKNMNINLKKIGQFFTKKNLWKKLFKDFNRLEIDQLCVVIFESLQDDNPLADGWSPPYINRLNELVIPFNAPLKYRWWRANGQSCVDTLKEIGTSQEIIDKYTKIKEIKND